MLDDIPGYPEDYFAVEDDLARASVLLAKRRVPETRGFENWSGFDGQGLRITSPPKPLRHVLMPNARNVRFRRMRFVALPFTAF